MPDEIVRVCEVCAMVMLCPATKRLPERELVAVATLKDTVPFPKLLAGVTLLIHVVDVYAVQVHELRGTEGLSGTAFTETPLDPTALPKVMEFGETV